MKRFITVKQIVEQIKCQYSIQGNSEGKWISSIKTIIEADNQSLVWVKPTKHDKQQLVEKTKAEVIICDGSIQLSDYLLTQKCFIVVENPKLAFLRAVNGLFIEKQTYAIHPTAFIHNEAQVNPKTYIGPFTYIGKCAIGSNTVIYGNCYLYDKVTIGNNVIIHAGTVIGGDGFGYSRNTDGLLEKFPHIGGVIIEDNVEIGANTCIDKGTLGNTHIKEGAKIDNLVHIAHNVVVGKHSAVIAHAMIGGSTHIGDYSWIAPSAALINGIIAGNHVTAGIGAVVTKNIPDGEVWIGSPARPIKEFVELQKKIEKL